MMIERVKSNGRCESGSVLVIVLWITFGIVSLALYFGHSASLELRAADNRASSLAAQLAIDGTARYVGYLLSNLEEPGKLPLRETYSQEEIEIGEARTWLIGRDIKDRTSSQPYFGLIDEASKLNLNTATVEMLEALPGMTAGLAAAIVDWRDGDSDVSESGAEDETYLRLSPAYHCKNAKFESLGELRLVAGADLNLLFGEDSNMNGVLDKNEDDGDKSLPLDNRDGRLDVRLMDFLTVYSREANTNAAGTARVVVSGPGFAQRVAPLLQTTFGPERANQILARMGPPNATFTSVLDFFMRSGMTENDFTNIQQSLTLTNGAYVEGLVNVCTAPEEVLACIPGIGTDKAAEIVAYRLANPDKMNSVAWVASVLDRSQAVRAGVYLTAHSYQFTADIAAVGHFGRGFRRQRFIFDTTDKTARIMQQEDLTQLGWALGRQTWQDRRQFSGITR